MSGWEEPEEDENCTVGYYAQVIGVEPVVGWMVCIKGAYRGESFKLKSGRNFIGRAANMDIVLGADQSVSRLRHAAVVYDPKSRAFIVGRRCERIMLSERGSGCDQSEVKGVRCADPWQYRVDADSSLRREVFMG